MNLGEEVVKVAKLNRGDYMYRKIEHIIEKWIQSSENARLITGARQVGKTRSQRYRNMLWM